MKDVFSSGCLVHHVYFNVSSGNKVFIHIFAGTLNATTIPSTCPGHVGIRAQMSPPQTATSALFLMPRWRFGCSTKITAWVYWRSDITSPVYADVWKSTDGSKVLVSKTLLPVSTLGKQRINLKTAIDVESDYFIGLHYDKQATPSLNICDSDNSTACNGRLTHMEAYDLSDSDLTVGISVDGAPIKTYDGAFPLAAILMEAGMMI